MLQENLNAAEKRLAPYLQVRKDYEEKMEVLTEVGNSFSCVTAELERWRRWLTGSAEPSHLRKR